MYNFILNPIAGRGKARKAMDKIEKYLRENNIEYKVYRTQYPQHAIEISKDISSGGDNVIAVGGDGTVSEVLNGMTNFESCALAVRPSGTEPLIKFYLQASGADFEGCFEKMEEFIKSVIK